MQTPKALTMTMPRPKKRRLNRLATRICNMAKDLCKEPAYKYSVVSQVGSDCIEITNDAGFRSLLVGDPHTGAYAHLYAENKADDGRWPSGHACFPPRREVARMLAGLCEGKAEESVMVYAKDSQSREELMRHLASVVAMAANGI